MVDNAEWVIIQVLCIIKAEQIPTIQLQMKNKSSLTELIPVTISMIFFF